MNALTHKGITHDFNGVEELKTLVRTLEPSVTQLWRDGLELWGTDSRPVWQKVGTLKEHVIGVALRQSQGAKA